MTLMMVRLDLSFGSRGGGWQPALPGICDRCVSRPCLAGDLYCWRCRQSLYRTENALADASAEAALIRRGPRPCDGCGRLRYRSCGYCRRRRRAAELLDGGLPRAVVERVNARASGARP